MKPNPKIAIYSGDIPSTSFIERLIRGLAKSKCTIVLFGLLRGEPNYQMENIVIKGYRNTKFSKAFTLLKYTLLLTLFRRRDKLKLDRLMKKRSQFSLYQRVKFYPVLWHKPDIFHIQWAKGLNEWMWLKEFGIKIVLSLRGAHINYSPIADKPLADSYRNNFSKVDAFHSVSNAIAKEAANYGDILGRTKTVYSGLDISEPMHSKGDQSPSSGTFNIISVGRPHWKKGYSYALDAMGKLRDQNFEFSYTIVGGSNLEMDYQIQELGLSDHVTIIKKLPYQNVQELISASDVLLLPSAEEGIANVVLEAMAAKTIVLSTNCGGMNEVIKDGNNGFLVPVRSPEAIADKIKRISEISKDEKEHMIEEAFLTIKNQHSEANMIHGMLELYQSI